MGAGNIERVIGPNASWQVGRDPEGVQKFLGLLGLPRLRGELTTFILENHAHY